MGSGKAQTVGYKYLIGMHMGLTHGPVDEVMEIRAGDRAAWAGQRYGVPALSTIPLRWLRPKDFTLPVVSTSPVVANETIRIYAPQLFGGDDREGGVDGFLDVMMGADAQVANAYLSTVQTGPQPAYRGILSVVFKRGLIASNNPYIKPWSFRLKRLLSGWDGAVWNSAKCSIDLGDGLIAMNPAHIIYECFTNRKWGHGMTPGKLDLASFAAAADTFYAEGMGLCIAWTQQETLDAFIQKIVNHCGAAVGEDPRTGLYRLKAIRDDYVVGSLQVFSFEAGNLVRVDGFERAAISEVKNEITVKYNDQKTGKGASVTVQNIASVKPGGTPSPETNTYPGIPTMELATRVAQRDLKASTVGLARASLVVNRSAAGYLAGDVIAFSWPDEGIDLMPMRIGYIDYGSFLSGEVRIECVQDVFGLPATTYVNEQPTAWVEPSQVPQASPNVKVFEMPYRDLVRQLTDQTAQGLDANAGYIAAVGQRPAGVNYGYQFETRVGSNDYAHMETGEWCPTGTLTASMAAAHGPTSVTLATFADLELVGFGQAAFIDNEMVRVNSYDPLTGAAVLARGCGDTVPAAHAAGARVWFYESFEAMDPTEWASGETVDGKVRTVTTSTLLAIGSSPGASVVMAQRAEKPYPPGFFRINATAYPTNAFARLAITWAHRDRILQQEQVVDTAAASVGPEAGTTYTVRIYQQPSTLLQTSTLIAGTSLTFDHALNADLRVELEAVRDGLTSTQKHVHVVTCAGGTLVVNGVFAADTNWTKGAGWTISGGAASKAAGSATDLSQALTLVPGASYLVDFTITSYGTGSVRPAFTGGTTVNGTARSAAGTFTETITAVSGNNEFHMVADAAFFGTIDNVVLRRIS